MLSVADLHLPAEMCIGTASDPSGLQSEQTNAFQLLYRSGDTDIWDDM
jgi:hypothetical protein